MKLRILVFGAFLIFFFSSTSVIAEQLAGVAEKKDVVEHDTAGKLEVPRYRLRNPLSAAEMALDRSTDVEQDWELITRDGPASGGAPILGSGNKNSSYDFRDGILTPEPLN